MRSRAIGGLVTLAFISLLAGVEQALAQQVQNAPDLHPTFNISSLDVEADREMDRQLDRGVSCDLPPQSLGEFTHWLKSEHHLNAVLDERSLEDAGLDYSTELPDLRVNQIPLRALLELRLRQVDVGWVARDGRLLISTRDKLDTCLSTRVYAVADLQQNDRGLDALMEVITSTILNTTWDEVGGPGTVEDFHDQLVVSQTDSVHRQIAQLLDALRKSQTVAGQDVFWITEPEQAAALDRYRGMKLQQTSIPCRGQDLIEAVQLVARAFGLQIDVDWKALEDSGIAPAKEFATVDVVASSPQIAFNHLLERWDLAAVPALGIVRITTLDKQDTELISAVYPVADIVPTGDYTSLCDLISTTIRPTTWPEVGGPASIAFHRSTGTLVFSQTFDVHQEVIQLLSALRRGRPRKLVLPAARRQAAPDDRSRETRVYSIPDALDPHRVAMFVREFNRHSAAKDVVEVRGQQVTVRASRTTQRKVQDMLDHGPPQLGGMGGMFN